MNPEEIEQLRQQQAKMSLAYEQAMRSRGESDGLAGYQPLLPDSLSYLQGYTQGLQQRLEMAESFVQGLRQNENSD